MNDAAITRGHGVKEEGLVGLAHALGGDASGKLQFVQAGGAVVATIEADAIVQARLEAKPAMGDVFQGQEELGVALKKQRLIITPEGDDQFLAFRRIGG